MLRESGDIPTQAQVLVLGAGIAGHCAALTAADAGAQVLFLEKSAQPGGSSAMAGGGFVFVGTDEQKTAGVDDSLEALRRDLLESGKGKNNPALIDASLANQLETYEFLRRHGVKFALYPAAPPAIPRALMTGTGRAVSNLHMAARAHPNIRFFSKSAAARLHRNAETGKVDAATVYFGDREARIEVTGGIILATGGFSRSSEILQIYAPELVAAVRHGGIANTGDGLMMATDLGAAHADIGYVTGSFGGGIRDYPHGTPRPDEVPPLIFSFLEGGIMVNKHGVRFINEGQSYKKLSTVGMEQPEGIGFQIFDQALMDGSLADTSVNNYKEAELAGYIQKADTIGGLAAKIGIDPQALEATIARYNDDVARGVDTQFGRTLLLKPINRAPFYIAPTANALTSTYGGIAADGDMAVVDSFGAPIEGLYAAGEVVGGFHGAGYYSASSLSSAATFGCLAGRNAARVLKDMTSYEHT